MIGRRLAHYRIVEPLGSGGMGEVYLAEDERLGRLVALKILPPAMAEDSERRMRFEREARAVAKLNHPNIVTIFSVEQAEGLHFFTMERVEGRSLSELIPEGGLSPVELARLAVPLVEAVAAAHRAGVTHRDLKPANVMVSDEGRVKVLDFGLAKLREQPAGQSGDADETKLLDDQVTELGKIVGTVAYMSPEQAEGKPADERSDVFSLGILLYQLATGQSPFQGDTNISLMSSILKDRPAAVYEHNARLPPELNAIIQRCLEKRPEERYASASEVLADVERFRRDAEAGEILASHTSLSGVSHPPLEREPSAPRLRGLLRLAAASTVIVVSVLAAWWWLGGNDDETAAAGDRRSLAVFHFESMTGDEELAWLRTGLTDMLVTDLSQSAGLRVLGTDRLVQILGELGGLDQPRTSLDVVQAVARRAGIGTAIVGSYVKAGDTLRINVRMQDAVTGELLGSEKVEGTGEEAVFGMVDDLTRRIRRQLALEDLRSNQQDRDLASVTTDSVEAYRHYVDGIARHERGDEQLAIPLLERAAEIDPDFAMALAKLSVAYGNSGDAEKAKQFAARALDHVDRLTDRERYYIEGLFYSLTPETRDRAIEAYGRAIEQYPDHNSARNNLAGLLMRREAYDEAITHLEFLRQRGMTFPGTYNSLARAYVATDRPDQALEVLDEYAREHPDSAAGHENLGQLALQTGRYDEAVAAFRRAETLSPGSTLTSLFDAYVFLERWDEARDVADQLERTGPEPQRWIGAVMAGVLELYHGHVDAGLERIAGGAALYPDDSPLNLEVRKLLAVFELRTGRREAARARAERLVAVSDDASSRRQLQWVIALADAEAGRAEAAERAADASRDPSADDAEFQRHLVSGQLARLRGDHETALREFTTAEPLLPDSVSQSLDHADVWFGLAMSNLALERPDEAASWFRTVIEAGPERLITPIVFVRSHWHLARILDERGEIDQARRHYRTFVEYWGDGEIDREQIRTARSRLES